MTLRIRIFVAFLVVALIVVGLGVFAVRSVDQSGRIVVDIFGRALIATSYARATAANFAAMNAALARAQPAPPEERDAARARIAELAATILGDLRIVIERATSDRVVRAAEAAGTVTEAWLREAQPSVPDASRIAALTEEAEERFEVLVNHVAGDAFRQRQQAQDAIVATQLQAIAGTGFALLLGALVSVLLARRIIGPVAAASAAATGIAAGRLDTPVPAGGRDELGMLLRAMEGMRDAIRATIEGEKAERQRAQARLADAMDGSTEGIVLADASGGVLAANARAAELLPAGRLEAGAPWDRALRDGLGTGAAIPAEATSPPPSVAELRRADGTWLRLSRSPAQDGGAVAVVSDISDLKAKEEALAAANARVSAALGNMTQGLCMVDAQDRVVVCNARFAAMFGLAAAEALAGLPVRDVFARIAAGSAFPTGLVLAIELEQRALAGQGHDLSFTREGPSGETIAVTHRPMPGGGWVGTYEDMTERRRAEERIAFLAHHDALTGLPNRVLFRERVDAAAAAKADSGGLAVLCLDLDRFKSVNDTLGHQAGDALLRQVADRLVACVRDGDTVARLGGDEFALVLPGMQDRAAVAALATRLVAAVAEPFDLGGHGVEVGASIGIAMAPDDGVQAERLLRCADTALYRTKTDGGAAFSFFEAGMDEHLQARRRMELDLRRAVANEELTLFYQPLVELQTRQVCGFEALLRWRHPERGMVPPSEFIPIAEEIGLIVQIGEWVLRRACHDASTWPGQQRVAVNVSAVQFRSPRLVTAVVDALAASGLPASRLELEITETVMLQDTSAAMGMLRQLHALGVRIAMDDFGTGYSSLGYLRSFPFDKIKIDQSFVRDLTQDGEAVAIVRAITGLGSSLGMRTTAEGVETEGQLERLAAEGCIEVQGYLFGRPGPASGVAGVIARVDAMRAAEAPAG